MGFTNALMRWVNPEGEGAARKRMLRVVLLGSLALHALAVLIFGGVILVNALTQEKTVFEAQPPIRTYEPRKVELKVKVQQKQRSSSRPQVVPRLVSTRPSNISLPDIKVDPKLVTTSFQPKFKAVSGTGMGVGLGAGYGTSGFGQGVSQVNFFGIQAAGERIAICVDVSVSMVEEERGGAPGFLRVKQRVNEVLDAIKDGTLFNLIVFADGCSILASDKMLYANNENRNRAKQFLAPFNSEGQWGHDRGNFSSFSKGLQAEGGTTRLDLALSAAMSQGADTILVISDGLPQVRRTLSDAERDAHNRRVAEWQKNNAAAIEAHQRAVAVYQQAYQQAAAEAPVRRVWVPPQPAQPAPPPPEGPPPAGEPPCRGRSDPPAPVG